MEYPLTFGQYNKALKKNTLLGLKCKQCGKITCPPQMRCPECSSLDLEVVDLSGTGTIQTYTTIYIAAENRGNEVPYVIVLVKLAEGPWIMGNLYDIDPDKANIELIGKEVKMGNRVFPGDKYSNGDAARPVFSFLD
ncbi:MAG: Zn-ribbon domain-containing OB-fold protein [Thermodesulfobacteriota bacterium]|nr:Zn-ribbon domain-containing OB-fold protein [Thermodesulfobacteriota bacterium]